MKLRTGKGGGHLSLAQKALWTLLTLSTLAGCSDGFERFRPIGTSPGVSGALSVQGLLLFANEQQVCLFVRRARRQTQRLRCAYYSRAMPIYLDRGPLRLTTLWPRTGTLEALRPGRTVEVYEWHWIKVKTDA